MPFHPCQKPRFQQLLNQGQKTNKVAKRDATLAKKPLKSCKTCNKHLESYSAGWVCSASRRSACFSRSSMRCSSALSLVSSTGTRWAKLLWARTSRVSSSIFSSMTACCFSSWACIRLDAARLERMTPTRLRPPVMMAARIAAVVLSIGLTPSSGSCRRGRRCG